MMEFVKESSFGFTKFRGNFVPCVLKCKRISGLPVNLYFLSKEFLCLIDDKSEWLIHGRFFWRGRVFWGIHFWCFPRPILAIFHIANVFLSGSYNKPASIQAWMNNSVILPCHTSYYVLLPS